MFIEIITNISNFIDTILKLIISIILFIVNLFLNSGSKTYEDVQTINSLDEYINFWFTNINEISAINEIIKFFLWTSLYLFVIIMILNIIIKIKR
jgi:hypothetical protein